MIMTYQEILAQQNGFDGPLITPFYEQKMICEGLSYGLSHCGYDVRIAEDVTLYPVTLKNLCMNAVGLYRPSFALASTMEKFFIPPNMAPTLLDKSTWARCGLAVQNTIMEPGWTGFLTLELSNHGPEIIRIKAGMPIAQVIFNRLKIDTLNPYDGKYQEQESGPQAARFEKEDRRSG